MRVFTVLLVAVFLAYADSKNQVFSDLTTPLPLARGETLVLGIVGGWERWDAEQRIVRRIALRIRDKHLKGVHVETVENHKLDLARQLIRKAFDFNKDGKLDRSEAADVHLVLFGQSLGGSSVVRLARELEGEQVPVLFTLQIDSVGKNDSRIPPNVRAAANLYQSSLPVRGQSRIVAEDPARTRIIVNRQYHYRGKDIETPGEPWVRRFFLRGHVTMEYDPEVWDEAERLLLSAISELR